MHSILLKCIYTILFIWIIFKLNFPCPPIEWTHFFFFTIYTRNRRFEKNTGVNVRAREPHRQSFRGSVQLLTVLKVYWQTNGSGRTIYMRIKFVCGTLLQKLSGSTAALMVLKDSIMMMLREENEMSLFVRWEYQWYAFWKVLKVYVIFKLHYRHRKSFAAIPYSFKLYEAFWRNIAIN